MRVLMLSTDRKAFINGSPVRMRLREYAQALTRMRHKGSELHVIVFSHKGAGFGSVHDGPLFLHPTNSRSKIGYLLDAYRLAKNLGEFAVVSAQDPFETGLVAWRIARRLRARLQLQIHTDFLSPYFGLLSLRNRIRVAVALFLLPKANSIRVVSKRIADDLMKRELLAPVHILPIFTNLEKLRNDRGGIDLKKEYPRFTKHILIVARLEKEKGIELAIRAFAKLPGSSALFIVGEGSLRTELESLATTLSIQSRVFFFGWQDSLTSLYESADALLVTSYYEGYGLSMAEAAALGCPIVALDVGVAKELRNLGARIDVVDKRDPNLLQNSLREMLSQGRVLSGDFVLGLSGFTSSKDEYLRRYIDLLAA